MSNIALAPRRKSWEADIYLETESQWTARFAVDRQQRQRTQENVSIEVGTMSEGLSQRWPHAIREDVRRRLDGPSAGKEEDFETLGTMSKRGQQRRVQAIWTGMITFVLFSVQANTLGDMGLRGIRAHYDDIMALAPESHPPTGGPLKRMYMVFTRMILQGDRTLFGRTPSENPILWWTAILVRSALESPDEKADYISRGQFCSNFLPMDLDIKGRIDAIKYHGKVLFLEHAYCSWKTWPEWKREMNVGTHC